MSLVNVYLELPVYPRFVAIDTEFKGSNQIFKGVKNPKLDLSTMKVGDDYEVIEGINIARMQGHLGRYATPPKISVSNPYPAVPEQIYGYFWVHKIAPYSEFIWANGWEAFIFQDDPKSPPIADNIINWDVYKHYELLPENSPLAFPGVLVNIYYSSLGSDGIWDGANAVFFENTDPEYADYLAGKWLWKDFNKFGFRNVDGTEPAPYSDTGSFYQPLTIPTVVKVKSRPTYFNLLSGYSVDDRNIASNPMITPTVTTEVTISYYRENKLEPIAGLRSIDWVSYSHKLTENIPATLPINDCVLGTLSISDISIKSQLINTIGNVGKYPYKYYFQENLNELFTHWYQLLGVNPIPVNSDTLRTLGANNNVWNNRPIPTISTSIPIDHPLLSITEQQAYDWHVKSQLNGSYGDLIMDSPRTIEIHAALQAALYNTETPENIGTGTAELPETPATHTLAWYIINGNGNSDGKKLTEIHKALDAGKWGVNPKSKTNPRVDNLGWRINRGNEVLGIRVKSDGTIDKELEKTTNRRLHVEGDKQNDEEDYNPNCFGAKGMLIRYLPNKFSPNGTVAGGYRKVRDIPQILADFHEQANAAIGYQEGTAIEINLDGKTYRYPNQLALLTEILVTLKQTATYSKGAFFSSIIGEQSIKEVMGGLGLRTVDKYIEFTVAGKVTKLYYKGISASQSIRRKLSAVATNVGMVIGNII